MLQFKLLFGVVSLMLVVGFAGAKQIPTSDKNVEQTYVIEPSNNWEATTIIPADIPPLIEGEPSAVSFINLLNHFHTIKRFV